MHKSVIFRHYFICSASTSLTFARASGIPAGFFPPACAMFGRPPPPPPTQEAIAVSVEDMDMNGLRDLGDQLKEKIGEGVVVIASSANGKVSLMATATDEAMKKGAHAGNLIKAIAST